MDVSTTLGQFLLVCALGLGGLALNQVSRLSLPLSCVLCGAAFGQMLPMLGLDTGIRASNFSDVLFFLLLPMLIFSAGWHMSPKSLYRQLPVILLLCLVGFTVFSLSFAASIFFGINHPAGFPVIAALVCAVLLAATDPAAVINQLQHSTAPEDLTVTVEGESLFNDALTIVVFSVLISLATTSNDSFDHRGVAMLFAGKLFGGILVGLASGLLTAALLFLIRTEHGHSLTLVFSAFGSFYIAEAVFHASGVISVLCCALLARGMLTKNLERSSDATGWLALLCNAVLFALLGLAFEHEMFTERWLAILIGIVAALVARALGVAACISIAARLPGSTLGWKDSPLLIWGGLHGAVTVALALSIPTELPWWWTAQSIAFGVVLFNLFVQGPTIGLLVDRLYPNGDRSR